MSNQQWKDSHKEEMRRYHREWISRNKEAVYTRNKNKKKELIEWLKTYKQTLSCLVCGENHPACLQFHHRDARDKELEISNAVRKGWSKEHILREISKCDVLCANCHFKLHSKPRESAG